MTTANHSPDSILFGTKARRTKTSRNPKTKLRMPGFKSKPVLECKSNKDRFRQEFAPFNFTKPVIESEWDRVQRLRAEKDPLFLVGGKQS